MFFHSCQMVLLSLECCLFVGRLRFNERNLDMKQSLVLSVVVMLVLVFGSVLPAEDSGVDGQETKFMLGLGALSTCSEYKGVDTEVMPLPLVMYDDGKFFWYGIAGGYRLWQEGIWTLSPEVNIRMNGYDADDSHVFGGMSDRKSGLDAGLAISAMTEIGMFRLAGMFDVTGRSKGQEVRLSYTLMFKPLDKLSIAPSLGAAWQNTQKTDYYYGVRWSEDNTDDGGDRPRYHADDETNVFVGVNAVYELAEKWNLYGMVYYEWLGDEITGSPLVDQHYNVSTVLGVAYKF